MLVDLATGTGYVVGGRSSCLHEMDWTFWLFDGLTLCHFEAGAGNDGVGGEGSAGPLVLVNFLMFFSLGYSKGYSK